MHNQCPVEKNIFIFCCKKNFVINDFWLMCTTQRQFSYISIWTQYIMKFDRVKCLSTSFVQLIYTNVTFVHLWDNFFLKDMNSACLSPRANIDKSKRHCSHVALPIRTRISMWLKRNPWLFSRQWIQYNKLSFCVDGRRLP